MAAIAALDVSLNMGEQDIAARVGLLGRLFVGVCCRLFDSVPVVKGLAPWLPTGASYLRRAVRLGLRTYQALRDHHAAEAASAMAYSLFLSLVPLLLVLGYALGHWVRSSAVNGVLGPLLATAPLSAQQLILTEAERLATADGASSMAPVAGLGFLVIAASGVSGLMNVITLTAGGLPRLWWHTRLVAFAFVVLGFGLLFGAAWAAVWLGVTVDDDPHAVHRIRFLLTGGERAMLSAGTFALGVSGVAAFYRVAVKRRQGMRRRLWPGAVFAVLAWVVVTWAFGLYVSNIAKYHVYYGGLAAIAVLLFWLWLTALALLAGAELNAQLEGARDVDPTQAVADAELAQIALQSMHDDVPSATLAGPPKATPHSAASGKFVDSDAEERVSDEVGDSRRYPKVLH
jgi:membrane protein